VKTWAVSQPRPELARLFAFFLVALIEERHSVRRLLARNADAKKLYAELEDDRKRLAKASQELEYQRAARSEGARTKLRNDNDGKQAAKSRVHECWREWQLGNVRYKSAAAFALKMVEVEPVLTSTKTVERWTTSWRREAGRK